MPADNKPRVGSLVQYIKADKFNDSGNVNMPLPSLYDSLRFSTLKFTGHALSVEPASPLRLFSVVPAACAPHPSSFGRRHDSDTVPRAG